MPRALLPSLVTLLLACSSSEAPPGSTPGSGAGGAPLAGQSGSAHGGSAGSHAGPGGSAGTAPGGTAGSKGGAAGMSGSSGQSGGAPGGSNAGASAGSGAGAGAGGASPAGQAGESGEGGGPTAGAGSGPSVCQGQGSWACDPIATSPSCSGPGSACDLDAQGTFQCFPAPNTAAVGEPCDAFNGPACAQGGTCRGDVCRRYCCSDADCDGGACEVLSDPTAKVTVGLCASGAGGTGGATSCDVTYGEVASIVITSCSNGCHGGSKKPTLSSSKDTLYTQLLGPLGCGTGVVPGKPESSILYQITSTGACGTSMPPGTTLSKSYLAKIKTWITCGAKKN